MNIQTTGPFTGKVFKSVDYAQLDWLANTHVIATAGAFLLPYGLYNERLAPLWIRNLQDTPITDVIGTRPNGIADGVMLRGNAHETPHTAFNTLPISPREVASISWKRRGWPAATPASF